MPLNPGTRLGAYEITSVLGAGGMGEVYRARDTRLDRSVAIKVLPAEFARDPQFRIRFEREARAISQLSHPNICTLHDIGQQDGVDYLVMELLEGQTLADRLARGPLPLPDVLRIGIEVAEALERAHRSGIAHRDLKPGNIMLTKSGAKLLDFGLALRWTAGPMTSSDATQQRPLTGEGVVVGTYQYMSPEQIGGESVDHRTDIFALGTILYEMVTGQRAFSGKTRTSVVAAILSSEPVPPSRVQNVSPPALDRLVAWCLAKDRDARMQSAHDVALELRAIRDSRDEPRKAGALSHAGVAWAVAALLGLIAAAAAIAAWKSATRATPRPETRFVIPAPPATNLYTHAAISPDGRRIVFRAGDARGAARLYLRDLGSTQSQPLAGTEGAVFSFWAPDNRQIGFTTGNKLLRMNVDSGEIRTLAEGVSQGGGASWGKSGVILFSPRPESTLYRVNADGGQAVPESRFAGSETHHVWPWFLPDGQHYLMMVAGSDQARAGVYLCKLGSEERTKLISHPRRTDFSAATYGGGHLYYVREFAVVAQKFDWQNGRLTGPPVTIDEGVELYGPGRTTLSSSDDGTVIFRKFGAPTLVQLFMADRTGRELNTVGPESWYRAFSLSKDERKIAAGRDDAPPSVWIIDSSRGTSTRVSFDRFASNPKWMSDSRSYVFSVAMNTPPNLMMTRGETTVRLTTEFNQHYPTSVAPDDSWVFFNAAQAGGFDIRAVSTTPPHKIVEVLATRFSEYDANISPDGKWLAYVSTESGSPQIFVIRWAGGAPGESVPKIQISANGGEVPRWSRDGRELYYLDPARMIQAVTIDSDGDDLHPSIPRPIFTIDNAIGFEPANGGKFLVARTRLNPEGTPLSVVQGFSR